MELNIQDKTPEQKIQFLRDNAMQIEKQNVKVMFSEEELSEMKSNLSDISIEENELKDELKEISKDLKDKIKFKRENIKGLLKYLKDKHRLENQEVYLIDDQDNGLMITYNQDGDVIESRKLRQSEKQTRIKNLNQAV